MYIKPIAITQRPDGAQPAAREVPTEAPRPARHTPTERTDSVQISDAGRALAARAEEGQPLAAERAEEIRRRVLDGAYNSLAVVDEVARRILGRGDLDVTA